MLWPEIGIEALRIEQACPVQLALVELADRWEAGGLRQTDLRAPLAAGDASLAVGGGGPSYAPMARSIMGGLMAGAMMSLFVVPAFYVWIDNGAERVKRFMRRTRVVDAPSAAPDVTAAGP